MNLLDGIVNAILGPDTSKMTETDRRKTEADQTEKRKEAEGMAFSASRNPGMQFMRPETSVGVGSEGIGQMIQTIAKFLGGGGGGG